MAAPSQRSPASLELLEQTVNEVLIHAGKAIRAQAKNGRKIVGVLSAAKINDSNNLFNATLDSIEADILRAKATLRRDLELVRAQKSAATAAAVPKQDSSANGTPSLQQAPPAPMDIDSEVPTRAGGEPAGNGKVKVEPPSDTTNGITPAAAAMAPFPNMDLDSPTATASPVAATMAASNPNRPAAPQAPSVKSPAVKKESLSRSPQRSAKPTPTPGAAAAGAGKMPAGRKTTSPAAARVPSPAASRSTASPVATKVPSPVLVKSAAASPAIVKASTSQPPTPTPAGVTAGASRAISLSSSSSSPSVPTTSPVLTKKAAVAKSTSASVKSTTPVPVPRIPTPITAPILPPPPPATTTTAPPATTAPPTTTAAAPVLAMEISNDINMDDFFDLTGPSGADERPNADLGFTNMQFSLVPAGPEEEAQRTQQQRTQAHPPPQPQTQPQVQPQARPAATVPEPVAPQIDDSDFDVEKFAADAAQNLMMDTAFSSAPAAPSGAPQQQQSQLRQQQQQQPQSNDLHMPDAGDANAGADNGDDLFKFIDDGIDGLGDDPTTNFDELYMGGADSIDIDDYFDTT